MKKEECKSRIPPITYDDAPKASQRQWDEQVETHGRMTNMKKTLARSPESLRALMTWYPLHDEVAGFLGSRTTLLFAHAISHETDCLICSTFFRRILKDRGEDPDRLKLDAKDSALVALGQEMAKGQGRVSDKTWESVRAFLSKDQMVSLLTFGAMMIATNVFNNAADVPLDEYLYSYQKRQQK